jgi:hypothetical protein
MKLGDRKKQGEKKKTKLGISVYTQLEHKLKESYEVSYESQSHRIKSSRQHVRMPMSSQHYAT